MKLEAQTLAKIRSRINEKVMGCCGTWIDWQYLLDAAALLAKCRYTLQYTYPYAYYMEPSPRKELASFNLNFEMGLNRYFKCANRHRTKATPEL
jgi:ariadne-2